MKNAYLLLAAMWLLSLRFASAQTTDSLRLRLDQVFANVDKSQVPTGRLLEYAEPLLPLSYYDGLRLDDTSRTNMTNWRALYATIGSARIMGSDTLPSLPTINARLRAASPAMPGAGPVPIAIAYVPYSSVRHDAFSQNLLTIQNEQVYDVSGRSNTPYEPQVLFATAPAYNFSPTGSVTFIFRRNLYLADGTPGTPSLYLDFDDGQGYQAANWNQSISTSYASAGSKEIKVRIVYTAYIGRHPIAVDVRTSHFTFEVLSVSAAARYSTDNSRGFTYTIAPQPGVHGGALVSVRYGHNSPGGEQIRKPFIIAEQYNIARTAPHLVRCNNPNNTIETFLTAITTSGSFNFNDRLELADYDLVYIDFTDNLDNLQNNAQVFEQVVQWVNQKKAQVGSTEQNVVMGLSMGGLIARYGLAQMTRQPTRYGSPDTRLLVLHDSPQRGAYNPLGVQAVTRALNKPILGILKLSDFSDEFSETVDVMDRGATRDLSILYATDGTGGYVTNSFLGTSSSPYRQMVDNVPSPGYTIVATSDGSQCGITQGIAPSTELSHSVSESVFGLPGVKLYNNFLGNRSLNVDAFSYSLPAYGQQARLSHVRVYYSIQVFPWFSPSPVHINVTVQPTQEFNSPPNTLPYENLPGGTANPSESSGCANSFTFYVIFTNLTQSTLYNGPICFVPSYSALDVDVAAPNTAYAQYINGTTANPSPPRVARYIAQQHQSGASSDYNLSHLAYTARNSEWIFDLMQNDLSAADQLTCSSECSAVTSITGPNQVCTSPTSVFSVSAASATQVTWTASPSSYFTASSGSGSQFTTTAASGAQGHGTITATLGCGQSLTKDVSVGSAYPTGQYRYDGSYYQLTGTAFVGYNNYVTMYLDQPYNFTFTSSEPNVPLIISGNTASFSLPYSTHQVTVTATAAGTSSDCGVSGGFIFVGTGYAYAVTPNPASSELTVSDDMSNADSPQVAKSTNAKAAGTDAATGKSFIVELFDNYGSKVKTKQSERGKAVLDVRDLPDGLYSVRVSQDSKTYSKHIQITH